MPVQQLVLIAAVAKNGCIGDHGKIPWERLGADLARFQRLTTGKTVAMGFGTWSSLPEKVRPLPNRRNVVLSRKSRNELNLPREVGLYSSIEAFLQEEEAERAFVIGGGQIYAATINLPQTSELLITSVDLEPAGDVRFPPIDQSVWHQACLAFPAGHLTNMPKFVFETYVRR